jgi:transposase
LLAPSVGKVTYAVCLIDLPELGSLSDKKIARLVGVAPMNKDSGKHKGKHRIEGGAPMSEPEFFCGLKTPR